MQVRNIDGIVERAMAKGPVSAAVVMPHDKTTVAAVAEAADAGLIAPRMFGDENKIFPLLEEFKLEAPVVHCVEDPIQAAIDSVRQGADKILIKGAVSTPALIKKVLDKASGLNASKVCSFAAVCDIPGFGRLVIITDGGLNVLPTLEQKVDIVNNAIGLAHALGVESPKVALLASVEEVKPAIPATVDAAIITQMARRGQIKGAEVDGPLALDNIVSAEAASKKGIDSPVAGFADIIVVPNIETGNALGKSLGYFAGSTNAGVIIGAKAPVVLPSRAGSKAAKLAGMALGALMV